MARRFKTVNATPEQRWQWFEMAGKTPEDSCRFELRIIDGEELSAAPTSDIKAYRKYVADNWFRNFDGVLDCNGDPAENTPEVRLELVKDLNVWPFISKRLMAEYELEAEGKGDSGSVS
jgi:hypothetical protein